MPDEAYRCGGVSGLTATSGQIKGLQNNVQYSVAVAAIDGVGNTGPLSNVTCNSPQQVDDFFEVYRASGGKAGGGYCATGWVGARHSKAAAFLLAAASLVFFIRRRRS
jgi:hypothetical protein